MRSSRPSELPSLVVPNGRQPGAALVQQPLAVLDEALGIRPAVLAVGGENRGDHAGEVRFLCMLEALA